jgi:hypothetical protein
VVSKPSLSGVHALKLFQPSIVKGGDKPLWYHLVLGGKNTKTRRNRMQLWAALQNYFHILVGIF